MQYQFFIWYLFFNFWTGKMFIIQEHLLLNISFDTLVIIIIIISISIRPLG